MKAVKRIGNAIGKVVGKIPVIGSIARGIANVARKALKNPVVRAIAMVAAGFFLGPAVGALMGSAGGAISGTVGSWLTTAGNFLSAGAGTAGANAIQSGAGFWTNVGNALSTAGKLGWNNLTTLGGLTGNKPTDIRSSFSGDDPSKWGLTDPTSAATGNTPLINNAIDDPTKWGLTDPTSAADALQSQGGFSLTTPNASSVPTFGTSPTFGAAPDSSLWSTLKSGAGKAVDIAGNTLNSKWGPPLILAGTQMAGGMMSAAAEDRRIREWLERVRQNMSVGGLDVRNPVDYSNYRGA